MGCSTSEPVYDPYATGNNRPTANPNQSRPAVAMSNGQTNSYPQQNNNTQNATKPVFIDNPPAQQPRPAPAPAPVQSSLSTLSGSNDPDVKRIEKFLEIQTQIDSYDKLGIFDSLRVFEDEVENLKKNKQQADINCRVLAEKVKKEKQDFDNITQATVQGFFRDQVSRNKAISKEESEYVQALNEEEIAQNELKGINSQYEEAKKKLDNYKKQNEKAIQLNLELANILSGIFDGDYGSETENKLETDVKALTEEKTNIQGALQRWSNARFLLVYAYNQITIAEQRWQDLMGLDMRDNSKVILATEVRNNLVASNQNLMNTRSNLKNVELPYCTEDDYKTLQGLASGVYNDMQSPDRQRYVMGIIQTMRKRCAALCQWIDQVIKESIVVEYVRIRTEYDQKSKQLKIERIRLMQEKIKEKTGKNVNIKIHDLTRDPTLLDLNPIPNQPLNTDNDKMDKTKPAEIQEKPVSIADLPPPPSKDQIMGNIEIIKQKYKKQTEDFNKNLEDQKREADEKLQKILAQYQPKVEA